MDNDFSFLYQPKEKKPLQIELYIELNLEEPGEYEIEKEDPRVMIIDIL